MRNKANFFRKVFCSVMVLTMLTSTVMTTFAASKDGWSKEDLDMYHAMVEERMTPGKLLKAYGMDFSTDQGLEEDRVITREEFYKIIIVLLGEEKKFAGKDKATFSDVPKDHWAFPYVERAYDIGLTNGIGNGQFGLGKAVTATQMLYIFDLINWGKGVHAYSEVFDNNKFTYYVDMMEPNTPVLRGQVFLATLALSQQYSSVYDHKKIVKLMPVPANKQDEFSSKSYKLMNYLPDFVWEDSTLYKVSKSFGTPEEDDNNYEFGFSYLAAYLENIDVYLDNDYYKYEFAYYQWEDMIEKYTHYTDGQLSKLGLTRESLDPSVPEHQYAIKFYEKYDKLSKAYELKANIYKKELKDKGFDFTPDALLRSAEEQLAAYEKFKADVNYQDMHENYKSYTTKQLEAVAKEIWPKAYLLEESYKTIQHLEANYKSYWSQSHPELKERIDELSELNSKNWISFYFFRGLFSEKGFNDYIPYNEFKPGEEPVYFEMTKAYYDAY